MLIVNCQHIKAYHGAQLVLEDVTMDIKTTERVGLVGRNGSGKTTLLRLLAKQIKPDDGLLTTRKESRIGFLAQVPAEREESTVYEVLASGYRELLECKAAMTELERNMSDPAMSLQQDQLDRLLSQYAALQERFEREGGYQLDAGIDQVANGLGMDRAFYTRIYSTLSGGEKTKVGLAAMLISKPDLLLLDEPTNHLDLNGVEWLEEFLRSYDGACLIVSHDRYFLDKVVTKIVELEDGESHIFLTNYTGYVKEKEERLLQQFATYQEQQKVIKKMKETIKQLEEWGKIGGYEKFFRRAASMQKALDRMEKVKRPVLDHKGAEFNLKQADRSGKRVLAFNGLTKQYGDRTILSGVDGLLEYGEKIMLVGGNGAGKSTLFKLLLGQEAADRGKLEHGSRLDIGYLAQDEYPDSGRKTVLEYFREEAGLEEGDARGRLARYLFYGAAVFKSVNQLSGGEWTRLRLALLVLRKPNLLLLDEPTNHMDITSREALEEALLEYPGTVLAISHDRYFINRLARKVWELADGKLTVFHGDFDAYKAKRIELLSRRVGSTIADVDKKVVRATTPLATKSMQSSRAQLESAIMREEQRLSELELKLHNAEHDELAGLWADKEAVEAERDQLYERLLELEDCIPEERDCNS
jgi:ATP-binding cassette subfamily F protein 3